MAIDIRGLSVALLTHVAVFTAAAMVTWDWLREHNSRLFYQINAHYMECNHDESWGMAFWLVVFVVPLLEFGVSAYFGSRVTRYRWMATGVTAWLVIVVLRLAVFRDLSRVATTHPWQESAAFVLWIPVGVMIWALVWSLGTLRTLRVREL